MSNFCIRLVTAFALLALSGGCVPQQRIDVAEEKIAAVAVTVSDDELVAISRKMRAEGDANATVAARNSRYANRLERLTARFSGNEGRGMNFNVYVTRDIDANATADGSIRVYSGLMDIMTDNELTFIIAHVIGHVVNKDSLDVIRAAYLSSGVNKTAAENGGTAVSRPQLGELLRTVLNSQFSQRQENDADAFAYAMMRKYRLDTKAAVSALRKINRLGASGGVLSRHPGSGDRVRAMQNMIEADARR